MCRKLVLLLLRRVWSQRLSQFLNSLAEIDRDFWLVSEGSNQDLDEQSCLLGRARHHIRVMCADLEGHPGDGLSHFDRRILEHVQELLDAWAQYLRKCCLVRAV